MTTLRKVYIWTSYIIALPLCALLVVVLLMFNAVSIAKLEIEHHGSFKEFIDETKSCVQAMFDGFKRGHRNNMLICKYGKDYINHLEEL